MSVVASPTQQGVTKSPTAAHLRTNVINGKVRIASQTNTTGGQGAVYHLVGGTITSNVNLSLPNITTDDTIATQGDNINWTGNHNFQNGLFSSGPINTSSSISAGSVSTASLTSTSTINSAGDVQAGGNLTSFGNLTTYGTGFVGTNMTVGGNSTVTGTHTVGGTITGSNNLTVATTGQINGTLTAGLNSGVYALTVNTSVNTQHAVSSVQHYPRNSTYASGVAHLDLQNNLGGSLDSSWFGIATGTGHGTFFCTDNASQKIAFHDIAAASAQFASHGNITAGATYTTNEQHMLADAYQCLRTKGLMT